MTYRPTKPLQEGMLAVDSGHRIHYAVFGSKKGIPVLFVHGGPGGGSSPSDTRFFNPKKYRIITFDQRGCGASTPQGSLLANTTAHLVSDMKALLDHLQVQRCIVFGGSWGSTLSLAFAIKYPTIVQKMVLRGIFLGTRDENDYFITHARLVYPESWAAMTSLVPTGKKIMKFYLRMLTKGTRHQQKKYGRAWARYEFSISSLEPSAKRLKKIMAHVSPEIFSRIELHYLTNNCFIPHNYLLRNSKAILHIPTTIIHGRYDCVCAPASAYALHEALPRSKLIFTQAGHSARDEENEKALTRAMNGLL